jgi:hypothetical protein
VRIARELIEQARGEGVSLVGPGGLLSQATRRRWHFPNEQAALTVLYLVIRSPRPNRANVAGKTGGWKQALNALTMLFYGERIIGN